MDDAGTEIDVGARSDGEEGNDERREREREREGKKRNMGVLVECHRESASRIFNRGHTAGECRCRDADVDMV